MNKLFLTFKEIANRLTGFSIPIFGISWQPDEGSRQIVRRVINFLEDKRVLYAPYELEIPRHCIDSIFEIRKMLTNEISKLSQKSDLYSDLQLLRAACRKFFDSIQPHEDNLEKGVMSMSSYTGWIFLSALGELRGVFGIYIGKLAVSYGIDVSGDLGKIFPVIDDGKDLDKRRIRY